MNWILTVAAVSLALVAMTTAQTECNRIKNGGFLRQSLRIDSYNSPCVISDDLIIGAMATLTVDPGVTLQFSPGVMLAVNGTLIARVSVQLVTHATLCLPENRAKLFSPELRQISTKF